MTPLDNPYPRPPEEQAEFDAAMEEAKAVVRRNALEEPNFGAGWRPWMGPRKEPTPEERAAHAAAMAQWRKEAVAIALADEEPFLTSMLRPPPAGTPGAAAPAAPADIFHRAADARPGEPVHVTDPATNRRFVLLPAEEYDRLVKAAG